MAATVWSRLDGLVDRILAGGGPFEVLVGPGGSGLSEALMELAERASAGGRSPLRLRGRRLEVTEPWAGLADLLGADPERLTPSSARRLLLDRLGPDGLLVVDDAQWLDESSMTAVVGALDRRPDGAAAVVAHRPWPVGPSLASLDALARPHLRSWSPLDEAEAAARLALRAGVTPASEAVSLLCERSAGVVHVFDALAPGLVADVGVPIAPPAPGVLVGPDPDPWDQEPSGPEGPAPPTGPSAPVPASVAAPEALVTDIAGRLAVLPGPARAAVEALAVDGEPGGHRLARVADVSLDELATAIRAIEAEGLLAPGRASDAPRLLPVVADAIRRAVGDDALRGAQGRLANELTRTAAAPRLRSDAFAAAGLDGQAAVGAHLAAADQLLAEDPGAAIEAYHRAAGAGAPRGTVRAGLAEARARFALGSEAVSLAAEVLGDPSATAADRGRATTVVAASLAGRGLLREAADRLLAGGGDRVGAERTATAAVLAVIAGEPEEAQVHLAELDGEVRAEPEGLAVTARRRMAEGLLASLGPEVDPTMAVLGEAADLAELGQPRVQVGDPPHAAAALVSLAAFDLGRATRLTRVARTSTGGGPLGDARHQLLAAWVDVRCGRLTQATAALSEVRTRIGAGTGIELGPRDQLLAVAIECGLARRAGDIVALTDAWTRAKPVLLGARVDLLVLAPVGEILAVAERLAAHETARPVSDGAERLLDRLGDPPLWRLALTWESLQACTLEDRGARARELAARVTSVAVTTPAQHQVREAAMVWVDVLDGRVDAERVAWAAEQLRSLGLGWEATHLTGQAAVRASDAATTRALLGRARDLKGAVGAEPERLTSDTTLSDRELEVAALVVDGLTHREIGERLFISPKTVEHHVARIRQKLGATSRAEMLAAIQQVLRR